MAATAYCDIFVPRHKPHSSGPDWKWCAEELTEVEGKWICPKHGDWSEAIKTMPHNGIENLRKPELRGPHAVD